jgi:hypothetical protein
MHSLRLPACDALVEGSKGLQVGWEVQLPPSATPAPEAPGACYSSREARHHPGLAHRPRPWTSSAATPPQKSRAPSDRLQPLAAKCTPHRSRGTSCSTASSAGRPPASWSRGSFACAPAHTACGCLRQGPRTILGHPRWRRRSKTAASRTPHPPASLAMPRGSSAKVLAREASAQLRCFCDRAD